MLITLGLKQKLLNWIFIELDTTEEWGGCEPNVMPPLDPEEILVCGFDRGCGEEIVPCADLDTARRAYQAYCQGQALRIQWYRARRSPRGIVAFSLDDEDFEFPGEDGGQNYDGQPYFSGSRARVVSKIAEHATPGNSFQMASIAAIAGTNPGAASACRALLPVGGEEALRLLVEQGITGSLVWLLFNDVCDRNPATAMQMLREGTAKAAVEERL